MVSGRLVVAVVALLLAGGCGGGNGGTGELSDDRHFGYIRAIDTSADPVTIEFDPAELLMGEDADRAALEAGAIEEGETAPNDHFQDDYRGTDAQYSVFIEDGQVTEIDEEHLP